MITNLLRTLKNAIFRNSKQTSEANDFEPEISSQLMEKFSNLFYSLGYNVATHPWKTIIGTLLLVLCTSIGYLNFHIEKDPLKLWIPSDAKFVKDSKWIMQNFGEGTREQTVIIKSSNILETKNLLKLHQLNTAIQRVAVQLQNGSSISWSDVCFKIPTVPNILQNAKHQKRETSLRFLFQNLTHPFNPSVDLSPNIFCPIFEMFPLGCYFKNILDVWKNNKTIILNLTPDQIIEDLRKTDLTTLLGGVMKNDQGEIISAQSLISRWFVYVNFTNIDSEKVGNSAGMESWVTEDVMMWEHKFLETLRQLKSQLDDDDFVIYFAAGRSTGDITSESIFPNPVELIISAIIMFVYMLIIISKFNWVELRIGLISIGLLCVLLSITISFGISSMFSFSYSAIQSSLPFLLMGLSVDDIFVVMSCLQRVNRLHHGEPIPIRIGTTLKHAGVSITVTSATDFTAFMVSSFTQTPALRAYCVNAMIGVAATYFFVITFFIAILSIDELRILEKINGLIPCLKHKDFVSKSNDDQNSWSYKCLKFIYKEIILTTFGKTTILILVAIYTGVALESITKLEQKFDLNQFIPKSTYLSKFNEKQSEYFPNLGNEIGIYLGALNYTESIHQLLNMSDTLRNNSNILQNYDSWIDEFSKFTTTYYETNLTNITESEWNTYLNQFLTSQDGGKYREKIHFMEKLKCGEPASNIKVSVISFNLRKMVKRNEYIPVRREIEKIVRDANLTSGDGFTTVWSQSFGNWDTNEIVYEAVSFNLLLALVCVMICTLIFIMNLQMCLWILIYLILTMINIGGYLQKLGFSLELITCLCLQLSIGLCVDYATHVGHTFLVITDGNKNDRALEAVLQIGSAVFHGGFSTILALIMLAGSDSYVIFSFFGIFTLVIGFGVFHGIVILPILLSLFGPEPYLVSNTKDSKL